MRKIVQLSTVTVFGALCFAASAAGARSSGGGVVGLLQKKYLVTQMTSEHEQITKDGTTMLMKAAGVYSVPTTTMMIVPDNKVVDGKVQPPNMFLRVMLTKAGAHILQTGDKVYITKMDSKSADVLHDRDGGPVGRSWEGREEEIRCERDLPLQERLSG
jgi:hypothetical protein